MSHEITIVIPVYNAFEEAKRCLESVIEHTTFSDDNLTIRVLVLDDASPNGSFKEFIGRGISETFGVEVIRNSENLGFTKNVNKGMEFSAPSDVVILNSDTIVSAGWLTKLHKAAYSANDVGSVTPFTNNGTICSLPRFCEDNSLPPGYSVQEFADLVEGISACEYQEIPSCVGFCTYFRRDALNAVGYFNAELFPRGYGEENDLSCRLIKAGYRNILDDSTFVFHEGGVSFRDEQKKLMEEGTEVIKKEHPLYFDTVSRFVKRNPLKQSQRRVQLALLEKLEAERSERILHILHNGPFTERGDPLGGTEKHVAALIGSDEDRVSWSLTRHKKNFILEAHHKAVSIEWYCGEDPSILLEILNPQLFPVIHLHHTRWFPLEELSAALKSHGNYIVSLHDFVHLCPRFHLFNSKHEHCGGKKDECVSVCGYESSFIDEYRSLGEEILENALKTISFSKSTEDLYHQIGSKRLDDNIRIFHGIRSKNTLQKKYEVSLTQDDPLRILLHAPLGKHKGSDLISELVKNDRLKSGRPIQWLVIGDKQRTIWPSHVTVRGAYKKEDLPGLIEELSPHLGLFASHCPETYSLAVDELIDFGIPMIVSPLGAPSERIAEWSAGWVMPSLTSESFFTILEDISNDPSKLEAAQASARQAPLMTIEDEFSHITSCYREIRSDSEISSFQSLNEALLNKLSDIEPEPSWGARLAGRAISKGLSFVSSLGIKDFLQRTAEHLLPHKVIEKMKIVRR